MQIKKLVNYIFIFFLAVLFFTPLKSFAAFPGIGELTSAVGAGILEVLGKAVSYGVFYINFIIVYIGGLFFKFGAFLIEQALTLNNNILNMFIVREGFKITLDIANLGFVLAIIIIAFATILRIERYGLKQILWKLIVAAVLINFSLTIVGVFIDFSAVLTQYFMAPIEGGSISDFANNIAASFGIQTLLDPSKKSTNLLENFGDVSAGTLKAIASVYFTLLFTVLTAITLIAIGAMMYLRFLIIAFLVIVMPIAWLFWIFPPLAGHFSKWWRTFFKWIFFLPASTFFLYLTISFVYTAEGKKRNILPPMNSENTSAYFKELLTINAQDIGKMILVIGLLTGGLYVAQKMGVAGADVFMKAGKSFRGWVGKNLFRRPVGYVAQRPIKAASRSVSRLLSSKYLRWVPGATAASGALVKYGRRESDVEAEQRKYTQMTANQFLSFLKSRSPTPKLTPVSDAAVIKEAIKRGYVNEIPSEKLKGYVEAIKRVNPGTPVENISEIKEILKTDPTLSERVTDGKITIEQTAGRLSPEEALKLSPKLLRNERLVSALSPAAIRRIYDEGSFEKRSAIESTLQSARGDFGAALEPIDTRINNLRRELQRARERRAPAKKITQIRRRLDLAIGSRRDLINRTQTNINNLREEIERMEREGRNAQEQRARLRDLITQSQAYEKWRKLQDMIKSEEEV